MTLQFSGTWEHALMAAVAKTASEQGSGYLGRTAMQKIVYFLQVAGVPMRYRFDIYHYGPYCDRITRDVEILTADNVLKDISQNTGKYSNYRPSNMADELLQVHSSSISQYQSTIETVVKSLLPFDTEHLELLATLDYLYRQTKAGGGSGPWKDRIIDRFVEVKKEKFTRPDVSKAYDGMVQAGLFEA